VEKCITIFHDLQQVLLLPWKFTCVSNVSFPTQCFTAAYNSVLAVIAVTKHTTLSNSRHFPFSFQFWGLDQILPFLLLFSFHLHFSTPTYSNAIVRRCGNIYDVVDNIFSLSMPFYFFFIVPYNVLLLFCWPYMRKRLSSSFILLVQFVFRFNLLII
jgi:hypothetical protein